MKVKAAQSGQPSSRLTVAWKSTGHRRRELCSILQICNHDASSRAGQGQAEGKPPGMQTHTQEAWWHCSVASCWKALSRDTLRKRKGGVSWWGTFYVNLILLQMTYQESCNRGWVMSKWIGAQSWVALVPQLMACTMLAQARSPRLIFSFSLHCLPRSPLSPTAIGSYCVSTFILYLWILGGWLRSDACSFAISFFRLTISCAFHFV